MAIILIIRNAIRFAREKIGICVGIIESIRYFSTGTTLALFAMMMYWGEKKKLSKEGEQNKKKKKEYHWKDECKQAGTDKLREEKGDQRARKAKSGKIRPMRFQIIKPLFQFPSLVEPLVSFFLYILALALALALLGEGRSALTQNCKMHTASKIAQNSLASQKEAREKQGKSGSQK